MKKLATLTALLGLALVAHGQGVTQSGTKAVKVSITGYVSLSLDSASIDITNALPGSNSSGWVGFKVTSNGVWTVSTLPVVKPPTYLGSASFSAQTNISGGNAGSLIPGTLTVTVSGLSYGDLAKNYPGGSVIITVAQS